MSDPGTSREAGIKILLVDDHPIVCDGLKAVIERQPDMLVVGEAYDGIDAQEGVAGLGPDLVIMDLALPRRSGVQATRQIKQDHPSVKVLVLTGGVDPEGVRQALEAGARGVMLKQNAAADLIHVIRRVAQGDLHVDPVVAKQMEDAHSMPPAKPALSERETAVLRLLAAGHTAKEIAASLCISVRTLETYRARGMEKLALKSRADIVRYAASQGWMRSLH